ncbi:hypothetical protein AQUCO_06700058v1, partial [Aquilegia coerulea]
EEEEEEEEERRMAFWGVEVKPGKPYSHQFHNTQTRRLHISQATLGMGNSTAKSLVQCNVGDKAPVLLCCLIPEKSESCTLALEFEEEDDDVIFSVLGPTSVHLTGFYLNKPSTNVNNADDDTDSYGEDIGDTENEAYDDDEDEYEDDFIDDDDIHFVPDSPRPKSPVVIEEILHDEKPAKVNGRKRLKKKYQVSDSDADAHNDIVKKDTRIFTGDSDDDEEGWPLSTVIKIKYQESDSVNDQKQSIFKGVTGSFNFDNEHGEHIPPSSVLNTKDGNILEESDKKELIESKKNEAEGGSNQVPGSERKIEDIDGCEIGRGIEQQTNAPPLSLEIGHETDEAPKKKKRKRTKDGQTGGVNVVDVQKKDKVEAISNLYSNDMGAGCVGHESVEKPKKKKKRANESRHGGAESDSKFDVQEEENFKVEARIDDTSKTEPVKDRAIDNLSNDKAAVQSSNENDVKTKKGKKRAEERQTCEVGDDSMTDVYKEETIQVKEAVSNDLNQEVPVKDNAIDNISNDNMGAGCVRHESEEKPKKKKTKRVKESRNDGVENDNKVDVQVDQNYKVEARIDEISKNEPVKDQADDNLSSDKAAVHSSHENDMKTKKRAKDRQTSEVGDDSIIGAYKVEKFQVQVAGSNDINQEVAVKDNAIDNISIDSRGDVQDGQENDEKIKKKKNKQAKDRQAYEAGDQDMINAQIDRIIEVEEARINEISLAEPFNIETYENISNDKGVVKLEVGKGIHEKPMKKKKKRSKEPTPGIDVQKQAKSLIVEANTNDIALEEPLKDEGIGNQSNEKCFVQQNDFSLLPLKIGHDNKEKQNKKKKKCSKEGQSGGVREDSLLVVHKEVQSGNFEAKTDNVTMEERITEEFDKQTNDMIVTIGANHVADEELTEKEKNETPNDGSVTNMTPESGSNANAEDAKK